MKNWGTKKRVLVWSGALGAILIAWSYALSFFSLCEWGGVGYSACYDFSSGFQNFFFPTIVFFLLSLITYRMKDEIFHAWWNFARWWVWVILVMTFLDYINLGERRSGAFFGGGPSLADILLLFVYILLILVSLFRIVRKYRELKRGS